MSLIRLLAAGSSISGIRDHPSPYKMSEEHLLPKFGSSKSTEVEGIATSPPVEAPSVSPVRVPVSSAGIAPRNKGNQMTVTEEVSKNESEPVAKATLAGSPTRQAGAPFWRWARVMNPFGRKAAVRTRSEPIQGELRLEGVKVIRNDLNDTDLEVVPAPKLPKTPPAMLQQGAHPGASKAGWRRITTRLFGASRT